MKKFITVVLAVVVFSTAASAQFRAVGLRAGYGAELSGQYSLSNVTFVEADLGWAAYHDWLGGSVCLTGVWDYIFASVSDFNFYVGPGAQLGLYGAVVNEKRVTLLSVGIAAQIGAEYQVPAIPLNISLDWRPVFNLLGGLGFYPYGIALGIRYRF